ncbi:unnamed protein product [Zymoseptoria tritici ST99CH_1E4]|nr:unnamed protein product [Zymoseptoria tritici ST99CH_1E4]
MSEMQPFRYDALDGPNSFRLLRLLPERGPRVHCELIDSTLSHPGPYEALSYTWGCDEKVEPITLNNKTLWITDNLHTALQHLLLPDRARVLWIDGICIDQSNDAEKSEQVRHMASIYSQADQVVFWLGKATAEVRTLMECLNQLGPLLDQKSYSFDDAKALWSDIHAQNDVRDAAQVGLHTLLKRPWFSRVWILQEVARARRGVVCAGPSTVPAAVFALAPALLNPNHHSKMSFWRPVIDLMSAPAKHSLTWMRAPDLYTLLSKTMESQATDPRDKIFALLGMSEQAQDRDSVEVNYAKPAHQVYQHVLQYLAPMPKSTRREVLDIAATAPGLATVVVMVYDKTSRSGQTRRGCHSRHADMDTSRHWAGITGGNEEGDPRPVAKRDVHFFVEPYSPDTWPSATLYTETLRLAAPRTERQYGYDSGARASAWRSSESSVRLLHLDSWLGPQTFKWAILHNHPNIIRLLVRLDLVHLPDMISSHQTEFCQVAAQGFETVVAAMLDMGFNPNIAATNIGPRIYGFTDDSRPCLLPLVVAVQRDHPRVMELLIDSGADIKEALDFSVGRSRCDHIELMISRSTGCHTFSPEMETTFATAHRDTIPQHDAHCVQISKSAMEHGADPNWTLAVGLLVLDPGWELHSFIELAFQHGADSGYLMPVSDDLWGPVDLKNDPYYSRPYMNTLLPMRNGMSLLQLAMTNTPRRGNPIPTLKALLQHGLDINLITEHETCGTVLQTAIHEGCLQCISFLLENGADVDQRARAMIPKSQKVLDANRKAMTDLLNQYDKTLSTLDCTQNIVNNTSTNFSEPTQQQQQGLVSTAAAAALLCRGEHDHGTEEFFERYPDEKGSAWEDLATASWATEPAENTLPDDKGRTPPHFQAGGTAWALDDVPDFFEYPQGEFDSRLGITPTNLETFDLDMVTVATYDSSQWYR